MRDCCALSGMRSADLDACCFQVIKTGRAAKALALSGQAAGASSRGKPSSPAMHTMLTVHLDTKNAQGGWTSSRISFVELAPVESKVCPS
jgi:hypothetical protein